MFWFFGYRPGFQQVWFFRMGCSYRQNLDAVLLVFPTRIILLFMDLDLVFIGFGFDFIGVDDWLLKTGAGFQNIRLVGLFHWMRICLSLIVSLLTLSYTQAFSPTLEKKEFFFPAIENQHYGNDH
jgi:hypothetical protein